MKILLDSHILLWALAGHEKLSQRAAILIQNPDNIIYYSVASLWELSLKHAVHPENVEFSDKELCDFCDEAEYVPLDVKRRHILMVETLRRRDGARRHKDPFDRILIAQAKAEGMIFLTHDSLLSDYGEPCVIVDI